MKSKLKNHGGMTAQQCECASCHRMVYLKMVKMINFMFCIFYHNKKKKKEKRNSSTADFPGGTVVKNPPANSGDMGSSPGPGRSHMPQLSPCAATTEPVL